MLSNTSCTCFSVITRFAVFIQRLVCVTEVHASEELNRIDKLYLLLTHGLYIPQARLLLLCQVG